MTVAKAYGCGVPYGIEDNVWLFEPFLETVKVIKMDATIPLYILNVVIVAGMFAVTVYRAWIEKQDLNGRKKIERLKAVLEREADTVKGLSGEEFIEMLKTVLEI